MRPPLAFFIIASFILNTLGPLPVRADEFYLPPPGVMVHLSPPDNPPVLKGLTVYPSDPFKFDFILDKGDSSPSLLKESTKLVKYFLASITTPENDLWVNLSPYEKNRIIPGSFGQTDMGRDLLAEDYILKQITASLIYPEDEIGKKFWKRIYEEAHKKYGTTDIPVNTFNKVWIVPDKAKVYEHSNTAYVVKASLKVMLEEDYLSMAKHQMPTWGHVPLTEGKGYLSPSTMPTPQLLNTKASQGNYLSTSENINALGSNIVRQILIPELTKEVNEGKNFATLRQVYYSLILAVWFKKHMKDSILGRKYVDQNKVANLLSSPNTNPTISSPNAFIGDPQHIYELYLRAFKKGVFNYIKEDSDPISQEMIPRKYFSGGWRGLIKPEYEQAMLPGDVPRNSNNFSQISVNLDNSRSSEPVNQAMAFALKEKYAQQLLKPGLTVIALTSMRDELLAYRSKAKGLLSEFKPHEENAYRSKIELLDKDLEDISELITAIDEKIAEKHPEWVKRQQDLMNPLRREKQNASDPNYHYRRDLRPWDHLDFDPAMSVIVNEILKMDDRDIEAKVSYKGAEKTAQLLLVKTERIKEQAYEAINKKIYWFNPQADNREEISLFHLIPKNETRLSPKEDLKFHININGFYAGYILFTVDNEKGKCLLKDIKTETALQQGTATIGLALLKAFILKNKFDGYKLTSVHAGGNIKSRYSGLAMAKSFNYRGVDHESDKGHVIIWGIDADDPVRVMVKNFENTQAMNTQVTGEDKFENDDEPRLVVALVTWVKGYHGQAIEILQNTASVPGVKPSTASFFLDELKNHVAFITKTPGYSNSSFTTAVKEMLKELRLRPELYQRYSLILTHNHHILSQQGLTYLSSIRSPQPAKFTQAMSVERLFSQHSARKAATLQTAPGKQGQSQGIVPSSGPGGIDLTAKRMKLDVTSDKAAVSQPMDLKQLENIEIDGLYITKIEIKPIKNLPDLLQAASV